MNWDKKLAFDLREKGIVQCSIGDIIGLVANMRQDAYMEGHNKGYNEGFEKGHSNGYDNGVIIGALKR